MKTDRLLRLIIPSVPILARTPLAPILDIADAAIKKNHPEWAHLPPASLRMRIGVGNHILRNHTYFLESGKATVNELAARQYLFPNSHVLELGCGCGRNALAIAGFLDKDGTYVGQDVDAAMIGWCQGHLQTVAIQFAHANIFSKVYNPNGQPVGQYCFPSADGSITIIISVSVFSHLLAPHFGHYVRESGRVLASGGHLHMTLFLLDFLRGRLGDRWTFSHKVDNCYVESLRYPEAAVAYELRAVEAMLQTSGLKIADIYHKEDYQQTLIAQKI